MVNENFPNNLRDMKNYYKVKNVSVISKNYRLHFEHFGKIEKNAFTVC